MVRVLTAVAMAAAATAMPDAVASHAFDRVKPAIVRIETHSTATYQFTLPDYSLDAENTFLTSDAHRIRDNGGVTGPSEAIDALLRDLANEIDAHPTEFFTPGTIGRTQSEDHTEIGSGVIVSPTGIVLTAAQIAPDGPHVAAMLQAQAEMDVTQQLTAESDGTAADILQGATQGAPPGVVVDPTLAQTLADAITTAGIHLTLKTIHAASVPAEFVNVELGPFTVGAGQGMSAKVLFASTAPDTPGVSVLQVTTKDALPVAPLAATVAAGGQQVVIAGYDSVGDTSAILRPTRIEGSLGADAASTEAIFDGGKIGGPVLNADGQVLGITANATAVQGSNQIRAALQSAHSTAAVNADSKNYQRAIDDYVHAYFRRALPRLEALHKTNPSFPYVTELIASAKTAIRTGKDKTPAGLPVPVVVFAVLANLAAIVAVVKLRKTQRMLMPAIVKSGPRAVDGPSMATPANVTL